VTSTSTHLEWRQRIDLFFLLIYAALDEVTVLRYHTWNLDVATSELRQRPIDENLPIHVFGLESFEQLSCYFDSI